MRGRAAVVATGVLAIVLSGLLGLVLVGVMGMSTRTRAVTTSVAALSAYQEVQRSLADEAFAEAGYRRAPGPASRDRLEAAVIDVTRAVDRVRALRSSRDDGVVNYLLVLNGRYEAEIRTALREGSTAPGTTRDDRVAGPALDAMQSLVDAAVSRQQRAADESLRAQAGLSHTLTLVGPLALVVAVLAIAVSWSVVLGEHRRMRGRAEASEHQARHDVLTGVGNRALLSAALAFELAKPAPDAALVMVDLDRFKDINDDHGHGAGDEVLKAVALRLREVSGPQDVVARMGGDEFAVLVRPASAAPSVVSLVRSALPRPVPFKDVLLQPDGSIGCAELRPGQDEKAVLTACDESLYAVKRARVPKPRASAHDVRHQRVRGDLPEPA